MDSFKNQPNVPLKGWRALFGGNVVAGRIKLYGFIAVFLLVGGLTFAFAV